MTHDIERWLIFVSMTIAMMIGTVWHLRQQRAGAFKGFRRLGEIFVGHQVVTDRDLNPVRFRVLQWLLGAALAGCWIGWCFLLMSMIR